MNYKIKSEAIVTNDRARNYIYQATTAGRKREGYLFIYPVATIKTGKTTTFKQEANYCQWVKVTDLEQVQ